VERDSNPLLFIGMPVYNSETTIRQTLKSIVDQDYTEWKLFISDNCSSDMTSQICLEFEALDDRIIFYQQAKDIGPWNNFVYVLEKSEGPYFKFQAADDVLSRDYISTNVNELEVDSSILGSTSPDCWDWEFVEQLTPVNFELKGSQHIRLRTLRKNCWRSNGLFYGVFRTAVIKKVITKDIFASKIAILDWLILARLAIMGDIRRCPKGLMILGSNGASNSKDLTWITQLVGLRAKLFPYRGFFRLVRKNQNKIGVISGLEIMLWVNSLNLGHYKGLFALLLSAIKNFSIKVSD
jgi:glycosyltransferase involved in cell wall biosynthesis